MTVSGRLPPLLSNQVQFPIGTESVIQRADRNRLLSGLWGGQEREVRVSESPAGVLIAARSNACFVVGDE